MQRDAYPVSFNQEWALRKHDAGRPYAASQWAMSFAVDDRVDASALEASLNAVIARHGALRAAVEGSRATGAAIDPSDGPYQQYLLPTASLCLQARVLGSLDAHSDDCELPRLARELSSMPLDPRAPPPLRALLVSDGTGARVLVLVLTHLVFDQWSVDLLQRDVAMAYAAHTGRAPRPPELHFHQPDFAEWERRQLCTGAFGAAATYWSSRWRDLPSALVRHAELPFARKVPASGDRPVLSIRAGIDLERSARMRRLMRERRLTPYVFFRTALTIVLHGYTGRTRLAFWANFANRGHPETESMIGWCSTVHAVPTEVEPNATCDALCRRVASAVLEARRHEALSLPAMWLTGACACETGDTALIFGAWRPPSRRDASIRQIGLAAGHQWTDLQVSLCGGEAFEVAVRYDSRKYEPVGIQAFAAHITACASRMCDDIDGPVSRCARLIETEGDRHGIDVTPYASLGAPGQER